MCGYCDVVGEIGLRAVFLKGMEANVCFIVQPSAGLGNVPTSASPGLGGGLQFL